MIRRLFLALLQCLCPSTETDSQSTQDSSETESAPGYDIETYRTALEEARRTFDHQLQAYNDVSEKAWRIFRLNTIGVSIYLALVANVLINQNSPIDLTATNEAIGVSVLGLLMLAVSTYLVLNGQQAVKLYVGLGTDSFESVRKKDPSEIAYLYKTLQAYETAIEQAEKKTNTNGTTVNWAKGLSMVGITFLFLGAVLSAVL